ncbi:acyltransferase family protein [Clostridium tyrobutyricum]|uniref:acyltransferase family protein n=1 Tax=Clostridium tyrobutyricum TaxID=1519 RepID=UPI001C386BCE|nr:acyltransferase [Clostridium tyrobutyricum]MBV4440197.1 acyltransferase [Clostridium tyrobutyricum]
MENKQEKLINVVFLKVVAILLVVLGHAMYVYTGHKPFQMQVQSSALNVISLYIYSFHMPLFIFISGYLYFYVKIEKNKYRNFKKFICNKFLRLGVPYIIFGFLYLVPIRWLIGYYKLRPGTSHMSLAQIYFKHIVLAEMPGHLWFIYALFGIFILFYIIEKYLKYNVKVSFIILLALHIISYKLPAYFSINNIASYLFYFYLGYLFRDYIKQIIKFLNKNVLIYIFLVQIILFIVGIYFQNAKIYHLIDPGLGILGIILCFGISIKFNNPNNKLIKNRMFQLLDRDSYPLYLFHDPIIDIALSFLMLTKINPFLITAICFIVGMGISLLLTKLFRIIKLKFIWGEKDKKIQLIKNDLSK